VGGTRIAQLASALGRVVEGDAEARLASFLALVRTWNARLDLTAARDESALVEVLFADALVMADRALVPEGAAVVDVGSGAGAPAIPFAIVRPDVRVTMVEPLRKRVAFLRTAIGTLDLSGRVQVIEGRIDPARPAIEGSFDVASARATFAPEAWRAIGLAIAPACLVFVAGDPPAGASASRSYALPWSGAPRVLARYER
jgi:16S rRNA (guanine527-N7)-methyltransferase